MRTVRATVKEFWSFVKEQEPNSSVTPCWEWIGPHAYSGYMAFRSVLAHRAAATIYCGRIPSAVSQRCENKKCMRLDHLAVSVQEEPTDTRYLPPHKQPEVIAKVLRARGNGRYKLDFIKEQTGVDIDSIKKILREAPLYDLIADIENMKKKRITIQMQPDNKVSHAVA